MFFVVPVTFSNMFILHINVFFGIYSFDLIRILLKAKKKNMCVYYLMKISNRVGRSIFFFILILFFIQFEIG